MAKNNFFQKQATIRSIKKLYWITWASLQKKYTVYPSLLSGIEVEVNVRPVVEPGLVLFEDAGGGGRVAQAQVDHGAPDQEAGDL